jgi:polar amino acid transport system substrate-binding protein
MRRFTSTTRVPALAGAVLAALVLAACGSSSKTTPAAGSSSGSTSGSTSAAASSSSGKTYLIGTSADFPPFESRSANDPNQIVGFEPDMMAKIMGHLGAKYKFVPSDFNGLIPALQSGRVDMVVSDVYDTALRRKVVDFVDYLQTGLSVMVNSSDVSKVKSFQDLCGKPVGILTGSPSEVTPLQEASKKCAAAGKSAIQTKSFPAVAQEVPALEHGTLFAIFEDTVTLGLIQHAQHGNVKVVFSDPAARTNIGIAVKKGSPTESKLSSAMKWYFGTPDYAQNAKKWHLPSSSLLKSS